MAFKYLLEDASGGYLLEDASGYYLEEDLTGVIVQTASYNSGGAISNTVTLTPLATPTSGNFLLMSAYYNVSAAGTITTPTGWTLWQNSTNLNTGIATYYKVAGGSEPTSYTIVAAGSDYLTGTFIEIATTATAPNNTTGTSSVGGSTNLTTAAVTPSVLNTLALSMLTTDEGMSSRVLAPQVSTGWTVQRFESPQYHTGTLATRSTLTTDTVTGVTNTFTSNVGTDLLSQIVLVPIVQKVTRTQPATARIARNVTKTQTATATITQGPSKVASYFVSSGGSTTTALTTPSFTPAIGEIIVVKLAGADAPVTFTSPTGGGLTYTLRASDVSTGHTPVYIYTTTTTSTASMTVSSSAVANTGLHSMTVERWTNAQLAATPATNATKEGTAGPSTTLTTTGTNSVVTWVSGDWSANVPTGRTYRSNAIEDGLDDGSPSQYVAYYAYQAAATAGSQTIGLSLPVGQTWAMVGIEIQQASGGSAPTKTQPAIARIATNSTAAQPATSRIAKTVTKPQTAIARVAKVLTKTQPATANITQTGGGYATPALVQTAKGNGGGYVTSYTLALGSNATAGNFLVLTLSSDTATVVSSITDSQSNTWTLAAVSTGANRISRVYYAANVAAGATTVTIATSGFVDTAAVLREYSGIATSSPLDKTAVATDGAFVTSHTSGTTAATTQASELVIATFSGDSSASTWTAGSGYGNMTAQGGSDLYMTNATEDKIVSATGTQQATATSSASVSGDSVIATFKAASTGAPASTKTQPATARIATNRTLTQPSIARIAKLLTKTQPSVSRIANIIAKTQPSTARIANAKTATQPALARVAKTFTKTQPAVARVATSLTKTQGAIGRVAIARSLTQPAIARVARNFTKTQPATANIIISGISSKTQPVVARIATNLTKTQPATARVARSLTKTQPGISRIATNLTKTQPAIARTAKALTKTQTATARIARTITKTQSATANIASGSIRTKTQSAKASIVQTSNHPSLMMFENVGGDQDDGSTYRTLQNFEDRGFMAYRLPLKRIRLGIPSWDNAAGIANMRQLALDYKADGWFVSYGITGLSGVQNATTYASWKSQVPTEAAWASAHSIDRFYIGNEEDWQASQGLYGTVTAAQIRSDVKSMATTLKASYPSMEIVYSSAQGTITDWGAENVAASSLDKFGFNMYDTLANFGPNLDYFMSQIGSKFFVSEWGSNGPYLDMVTNQGYSDTDYANDLRDRYAALVSRNIESYHFALRYSDNTRTTGHWNVYDDSNKLVPGAENAWGASYGTGVSIANKLSGVSTNATSFATASWTPQANKLYLASFVSRTGITTDPTVPTASGNGLTWVQVGTVLYDDTSSSRRRVTLFRAMGASPTTGALTFDEAGQTQTDAGWSIEEVTNANTSGTNGSGAIVQSVTNVDSSGAATSLAVTLATFASSSNVPFGSFGYTSAGGAISIGSGYTQLTDTTLGGSSTRLTTEWKSTSGTSISLTPDGAQQIGGIAVEIAAAAATPTTTKTQTATARIARNVTKTQTAAARLSRNLTKTQPSVARLSRSLTKTQPATANIQPSSARTKTQPATARIARTITKTVTAIARISVTRTATQPATARIATGLIRTKTQTATASIIQVNARTKTQSAKAYIVQNAVGLPITLDLRIASPITLALNAPAITLTLVAANPISLGLTQATTLTLALDTNIIQLDLRQAEVLQIGLQ